MSVRRIVCISLTKHCFGTPNRIIMNAALYQSRRARLAAQLGDGIAIIATAPEAMRNRDTHYPYRFDSYFYYLTGFTEPEAVTVIIGGASPRALLFCRDKDETREIWDGFRYGPKAAQQTFAFDAAYSIAELDTQLPELMGNIGKLAYAVGFDPAWDARVLGWLNSVRGKARQGIRAPTAIVDVRAMLDEMRLFKDSHEIDTMRRAGQIALPHLRHVVDRGLRAGKGYETGGDDSGDRRTGTRRRVSRLP